MAVNPSSIDGGFVVKARGADGLNYTAGNYPEQSTAEKRAIEVLRDGLTFRTPQPPAVFGIIRIDEAWVEPL